MAHSPYVRIRLWFQPYYRPRPKKQKTPKKKAEPQKTTEERHAEVREANNEAALNAHRLAEQAKYDIKTFPRETIYDVREWKNIKGIYVNEVFEPLDELHTKDELPYPSHSWYYHDAGLHQLMTHVIPGTAFLYTERSDAHRKKLRPLIYPKDGSVPFDRTHLIPFGYHGVEDDPRLLIGWDSSQNRKEMNNFEQKQKKRKTPFYWLVSVNRTLTGAELTYKVFDAKTMKELDQLHLSMEGEFHWKD